MNTWCNEQPRTNQAQNEPNAQNNVWNSMCKREHIESSQRNRDMFGINPEIKPNMRSIVFEWLMKICEVHKLQRETYYLALHFFDCYLSSQSKIVKSELQLIGITCLFIASKIEEVYPPMLQDFVYHTDGECNNEKILEKELAILKALNWNLSLVTVHAWLNYLFFRIIKVKSDFSFSNQLFFFPDQIVTEYLKSARLLDLCVWDEGSLKFSYRVLATSSLYFSSFEGPITSAADLKQTDLEECIAWMRPFAAIFAEKKVDKPEDSYLVQKCTVDLTLLEKAQAQIKLKINLKKAKRKLK